MRNTIIANAKTRCLLCTSIGETGYKKWLKISFILCIFANNIDSVLCTILLLRQFRLISKVFKLRNTPNDLIISSVFGSKSLLYAKSSSTMLQLLARSFKKWLKYTLGRIYPFLNLSRPNNTKLSEMAEKIIMGSSNRLLFSVSSVMLLSRWRELQNFLNRGINSKKFAEKPRLVNYVRLSQAE